MVNVSSSSSSVKTGPPSKKASGKSRQKHANNDENTSPRRKQPPSNAKVHAEYTNRLKKLQAENDALRKAATARPKGELTIPRPHKGVGGRGFNLCTAMGLNDDKKLYSTLRRCVRGLADRAGLDFTLVWGRQPKETIGQIIGAARNRHEYFNRFPHGWPIEEFLKTYLKNKRSYARKVGPLEDQTNQNEKADGEDSEGDEEMDQDKMPDADEENDDPEWGRGNGWGNRGQQGPEGDEADMYA